MGLGNNPTGQKQNENETTMKEIIYQNKFSMLRNPKEQAPILEEGEVQQSQGLIRKEILVAQDLGSPNDGFYPTYAEMEKKKPIIGYF